MKLLNDEEYKNAMSTDTKPCLRISGSASSPLGRYYWLGERGGWSFHVSVRVDFEANGKPGPRRLSMGGVDRCVCGGGQGFLAC